jgi:hypothetical protein
MEVSDKKQVKLFNKVYVQLQDAVKVSLKRMNSKTYKVKTVDEIARFDEEMTEHTALYVSKDADLLKKVKILDDVFSDKPQLSKANIDVVWKFIEAMMVVAKKNKTEIDFKAVADVSSLQSLADTLMGDESSGFKSIVEDIASQLESSFKGKEVDQTKIISDLMAGNLKTSGIDFEKIIKNTTQTLGEKVKSGEVDLDKLKETSDKITTLVKK